MCRKLCIQPRFGVGAAPLPLTCVEPIVSSNALNWRSSESLLGITAADGATDAAANVADDPPVASSSAPSKPKLWAVAGTDKNV